jgi:hypothetical protein
VAVEFDAPVAGRVDFDLGEGGAADMVAGWIGTSTCAAQV